MQEKCTGKQVLVNNLFIFPSGYCSSKLKQLPSPMTHSLLIFRNVAKMELFKSTFNVYMLSLGDAMSISSWIHYPVIFFLHFIICFVLYAARNLYGVSLHKINMEE